MHKIYADISIPVEIDIWLDADGCSEVLEIRCARTQRVLPRDMLTREEEDRVVEDLIESLREERLEYEADHKERRRDEVLEDV